MKRLTLVWPVMGLFSAAVTGLVASRPTTVTVNRSVAFDLSAPLEQFIPNKAVVIHPAELMPAAHEGSISGPGMGLGSTPPSPPRGAGRAGRSAPPWR